MTCQINSGPCETNFLCSCDKGVLSAAFRMIFCNWKSAAGSNANHIDCQYQYLIAVASNPTNNQEFHLSAWVASLLWSQPNASIFTGSEAKGGSSVTSFSLAVDRMIANASDRTALKTRLWAFTTIWLYSSSSFCFDDSSDVRLSTNNANCKAKPSPMSLEGYGEGIQPFLFAAQCYLANPVSTWGSIKRKRYYERFLKEARRLKNLLKKALQESYQNTHCLSRKRQV